MTCTPHKMSSEWPNQEEQDGRGMWHVWEREEKRIQAFAGNPERNHLEGQGADRTITIKVSSTKQLG